MDGNSYFHVGLVVEKIGPALEQLTELAGYTWHTPMTVPVAVRDAEGAEYTVEITMVYSNQAPYLEVIEGIPGTPWAHDPNGSNLHHLGFAVEDPAAAGAHAATCGCPLEVGSLGENGEFPTTFSYHRGMGIRLEMVQALAAAAMTGNLG
jgi:hypothetical protein